MYKDDFIPNLNHKAEEARARWQTMRKKTQQREALLKSSRETYTQARATFNMHSQQANKALKLILNADELLKKSVDLHHDAYTYYRIINEQLTRARHFKNKPAPNEWSLKQELVVHQESFKKHEKGAQESHERYNTLKTNCQVIEVKSGPDDEQYVRSWERMMMAMAQEKQHRASMRALSWQIRFLKTFLIEKSKPAQTMSELSSAIAEYQTQLAQIQEALSDIHQQMKTQEIKNEGLLVEESELTSAEIKTTDKIIILCALYCTQMEKVSS